MWSNAQNTSQAFHTAGLSKLCIMGAAARCNTSHSRLTLVNFRNFSIFLSLVFYVPQNLKEDILMNTA